MAKNHHLVCVVDICFQKGLLLQRTSIYEENEFESWNLIPDLRIDLVSTSLIWLTCDNNNLLELYVFEILGS